MQIFIFGIYRLIDGFALLLIDHHHHHLFLKRPKVPRYAPIRRLSHVWSPSTYPSILPIQAGTQFHVIFHTRTHTLE